MLQSIYIQNYALIDKLEMNFYPGFSVITGETGAGKSIILGAIGLLLGQRADAKAIKNGASKSIVEAHFRITGYGMKDFFEENDIEFDEDECILRVGQRKKPCFHQRYAGFAQSDEAIGRKVD